MEIIKCPTGTKGEREKPKKWIDWVFREMSGLANVPETVSDAIRSFVPVGRARTLTKADRSRLTDEG